MIFRAISIVLLLSTTLSAGIIEEVRGALAGNQFSSADAMLKTYQTQHGVDSEYLEALSWMARSALASGQLDQAQAYAAKTESLSRQQLRKGKLDSQPHLATALGAALEVESQVLAKKNQRTEAVALLRKALVAYGNTSIRARLQKNLNLLSLVGKPAPQLDISEHLGPQPTPLARISGSPVLLFFWAHWCGDCKAEAPIIAQLRTEFAPKGLVVVGPTQLYGFAGQQDSVTPQQELAYIEAVRQRYYSALLDMPVPVSQKNFNNYGASTTPTIVVLDRGGHVSLYHPGAMSYNDLRAAIEKTL
jgi:thiol-disulfide isomerase/thioredoxin